MNKYYNLNVEKKRIIKEWKAELFSYRAFIYSHDLRMITEVIKDSWREIFNELYEKNSIDVDRYTAECFDYDEEKDEEVDKTEGWTDEQWFEAIIEYFNDREYPYYEYFEIKCD